MLSDGPTSLVVLSLLGPEGPRGCLSPPSIAERGILHSPDWPTRDPGL